MKEWMPQKEKVQFLVPAIPYGNRISTVENSQDRSSSSATANIRSSKHPNFFRNEGGRWSDCRTTLHKWYYTGKCTSAMQVNNKKEIW